MTQPIYLTQEKKEAFEAELQMLKTVKRVEIIDRLAFAKSLGDLSENAEYHSSKEDQGKNEARISQIEAMLKDPIMVEANTDGTIGLGSTVVVNKEGSDNEKTYLIVGAQEADVAEGKMSFDSPMGSKLMDKVEGDVVVVSTPRGETSYCIKKVS